MKTPAVVVTVAAALVIGAQARTLRADGPTAAPFTKRSCAAAAVLATMAAPGADIYPPEQTAADLAFASDDVGASLYAIGRYLAARGMPVRAYKTPDSVAVPVPFIAYMAGQAHFVVVVARTKRYVARLTAGKAKTRIRQGLWWHRPGHVQPLQPGGVCGEWGYRTR